MDSTSLTTRLQEFRNQLPDQLVERVEICAVTGALGGLVLRGVHWLPGGMFLPLGYLFFEAINHYMPEEGVDQVENGEASEHKSPQRSLKGRAFRYLGAMTGAYFLTSGLVSGLSFFGTLALTGLAFPLLALDGIETIAKGVKLVLIYFGLSAERREEFMAKLAEQADEYEVRDLAAKAEAAFAELNTKLQDIIKTFEPQEPRPWYRSLF